VLYIDLSFIYISGSSVLYIDLSFIYISGSSVLYIDLSFIYISRSSVLYIDLCFIYISGSSVLYFDTNHERMSFQWQKLSPTEFHQLQEYISCKLVLHYVYSQGFKITQSDDFSQWCRDRRGRDQMVVGFTTTYAISAYHH